MLFRASDKMLRFLIPEGIQPQESLQVLTSGETAPWCAGSTEAETGQLRARCHLSSEHVDLLMLGWVRGASVCRHTL